MIIMFRRNYSGNVGSEERERSELSLGFTCRWGAIAVSKYDRFYYYFSKILNNLILS